MASRDLNDLSPTMQRLVGAFLAAAQAAGIEVLVTCTWRSDAEQDVLYSQGRSVRSPIGPWPPARPLGSIVTDARAGQSAHNVTAAGLPSAMAFDVVPMIGGKPVWDAASPLWGQLGKIGQSVGLEWYGAPGAPFHEAPHFQDPAAPALLAQLRAAAPTNV